MGPLDKQVYLENVYEMVCARMLHDFVSVLLRFFDFFLILIGQEHLIDSICIE